MGQQFDLERLQQSIYAAFTFWFEADSGDSPFADLDLFRQQGPGSAHEVTRKILLTALEALKAERPPAADLLSRRFLQGEQLHLIALTRKVNQATIYRQQSEAIAHLARILHSFEAQARVAQQAVMTQRLAPPTRARLVGVEAHLTHLLEVLLTPGPPWLVTIEGQDGLGKSALADAVARRAIEQSLFEAVAWVNAKPPELNFGRSLKTAQKPALTAEQLVEQLLVSLRADPVHLDSLTAGESFAEVLAALQGQLTLQPHLIVIDNLATRLDVESLLPTLHQLSNPTKFLLTSPEKLARDQAIYHFSLPSLDHTQALQLIRHEAARVDPPYLKNVSEADLLALDQWVAGQPLAMRLVIGQTHIFSLATILTEVSTACDRDQAGLYPGLYHYIWQRLDQLSRQVLLAMLLTATSQGTLAHLSALSELEPSAVQATLDWLVTLNLIDRRDDSGEPHYTIHNLTRTFLHEQVLRWE